MHSAKIITDSRSVEGVRLTTMEVCFPRIILAELNTHRVFSRNSASSRAIPTAKMLAMVRDNPYVPSEWGANQSGMSADVLLTGKAAEVARDFWMKARLDALRWAGALAEFHEHDEEGRHRKFSVHKQLTNRLLEPFMWHTAIISATEWSNFFHLRSHPAAHPDIRTLSDNMRHAYEESAPKRCGYGEWHLPYVHDSDLEALANEGATNALIEQTLMRASVGRCARVSYLTHDGRRDIAEDIKLHDKLLESGHMSPFEHVARPIGAGDEDQDRVYVNPNDGYFLDGTDTFRVPSDKAWCGNFRGWVQYRKTIENEHDILGKKLSRADAAGRGREGTDNA